MTLYIPQQTDTDAQDGVDPSASGLSLGPDTESMQIETGGTAGTTTKSCDTGTGVTDIICVAIQSIPGEPRVTKWRAGTWTVRVDVVQENRGITWNYMGIFRCPSTGPGTGDTQIGVNTNVNQKLDIAGVKTATLAGVQTSGAQDDEIYIVLAFDHGGPSNGKWGFKGSQLVDTPLGSRAFVCT